MKPKKTKLDSAPKKAEHMTRLHTKQHQSYPK